MSTLLISQKGNLGKVKDELLDLDFAKAVLAMRLAVIFSTLRPAAEMRDLRVAMTNLIQLEIPSDWLKSNTDLWPRLIKEKDCWRKVGRGFSMQVGQTVGGQYGDPLLLDRTKPIARTSGQSW